MGTDYQTHLRGMECFSSLFPDESQQVAEADSEYQRRLAAFPDDKMKEDLNKEYLDTITRITDKAMKGPSSIQELKDIYIMWLLDKDITLDNIVIGIIELNVAPLVLRGLIEELFEGYPDVMRNTVCYVDTDDAGNQIYIPLRKAVNKTFSFNDKHLVLCR